MSVSPPKREASNRAGQGRTLRNSVRVDWALFVMGNHLHKATEPDRELAELLHEGEQMGWLPDELSEMSAALNTVFGTKVQFSHCLPQLREKGAPGAILHRLWLFCHHLEHHKSVKGSLDLDAEFHVPPALHSYDGKNDDDVFHDMLAMARAGGGAGALMQGKAIGDDRAEEYRLFDEFEDASKRRMSLHLGLHMFDWFSDTSISQKRALVWALFQVKGVLYRGRLLLLGIRLAQALGIPFGDPEASEAEALLRDAPAGGMSYGEFRSWWKKHCNSGNANSGLIWMSFGLVNHYQTVVHRIKTGSSDPGSRFSGMVRVDNSLHSVVCKVQAGIVMIGSDKVRQLQRSIAKAEHSHKKLTLTLSDGETIHFRCKSLVSRNLLLHALNANAVTVQKLAGNRFSSYHGGNFEKPVNAFGFVDGAEYFGNLVKVLREAKKEILIADWSLQPCLYLYRGEDATADDRLDFLLKRKAADGVKIYILVWWEVSLAVGTTVNSGHVESVFAADKNIMVLRHPKNNVMHKWSHHQKFVVVDREIAYVGGLDLCNGRYDTPDHPLVDNNHLKPLFPGKDYYNPLILTHSGLDRPFVDLLDRDTCCRLPWHDVHARVDGDCAKAVAQNFLERWNVSGGASLSFVPEHLSSSPRSMDGGLPVKAQILRSLSEWSGGPVGVVESSILEAHLKLIDASEHFIYIENQFFISSLAGSVQNQISAALVKRIARAYKEGSEFRVVVLMPLHSEGYFNAATTRMIYIWTYKTIMEMMASMEKLCPGIRCDDFVGFYCPLNHAELHGVPFLNMIYVHSKLMIVDDRHCIVGSANINDRSLLGDRDSEIAVYMESCDDQVTRLKDGREYRCSKLISSWRSRLWQEHLGVADASDPFFTASLWKKHSEINLALASPSVRVDAQRIWDHIQIGLPQYVDFSGIQVAVAVLLRGVGGLQEAKQTCDCCMSVSDLPFRCVICDAKLCDHCATRADAVEARVTSIRRKVKKLLLSAERPEELRICHLCSGAVICPVLYEHETKTGGVAELMHVEEVNASLDEVLADLLKKVKLPHNGGMIAQLLQKCDSDKELAAALLSFQTKERLAALRGHVFPFPATFCPRMTPSIVQAAPTDIFI